MSRCQFQGCPVTAVRAANRSICDRIRLNTDAVGAREDWVEFEVHANSPATNSIRLESAGRLTANTRRVRMVTLDGYCRENGIRHIDLLKIDTEGFEPYVLQGAAEMLTAGRVSLILLENCPALLLKARTSPYDLYNWISKLGYQPRALTPAGEPGEVLSAENLASIDWADILSVPSESTARLH
jgi:FkbM family methyltransferase